MKEEMGIDGVEKKTKGSRRIGQIEKRGPGRYMVRVPLGTDHKTGKRLYHNHTVHGRLRDAEKYLTAKTRELDLGVFIEPTKMTLGEYLDEWLAIARQRVTRRTADGYEGQFDRYIREPLGKVRLTNLRASDIQKVYGGMIERGLSARSVRNAHAPLSGALEYAVKVGHIHRNPAELVELPKIERIERRFFSPEEAGRFLLACAKMPNGLIFEFSVMTGMRNQEYLALQWRDVDFERGTVTINRALEYHRGEWRFKETKTARSRRCLPLPGPLMEKLRQHKRTQSEARLMVGSLWQNYDLVFCTEIGTPHQYPNLTYRYFRPILEAAGFPRSEDKVRMYDLRHSHASLLLAAEENLKVVSERLGHASIRLTADIYSHVSIGMQQGATDKLEEMLYKAG